MGRLFQADAEFVVGDATEIPRPHAYRTPYVGKLSDDKTRGYWLLVLATPYPGRALPCHLLSYSSRTIAQGAGSRNLQQWEAFDMLKDLLGDKPLVLDRDFSYLELLQYCVHVQINFVIRLNLRSHPQSSPMPSGCWSVKPYATNSTNRRPPAPRGQRAAASDPAQRKWQRYSGLFILLRQKLQLPQRRLRQLAAKALQTFAYRVRPLPVRS